MSLRLGLSKLANLGIYVLSSVTSKELQFRIIPQRILSAQIVRNYGDRFSIAPKKKKIRKTTGNRNKRSLRQPQVFQLDPLKGKDASEILIDSGRQQAISGAILQGITGILNSPELDSSLRVWQLEITRVRVTPDLGYATIYWTVSGESKDDVETVQSLLDENSNYIRRLLPAYSSLVRFPQLIFTKDNSAEYKAEMEHLLNKAKLNDTGFGGE